MGLLSQIWEVLEGEMLYHCLETLMLRKFLAASHIQINNLLWAALEYMVEFRGNDGKANKGKYRQSEQPEAVAHK